MIKPNLQCGFHHNVHILRIYISNPSVVLVWPLGNNFKRNFVQYDREGTEKMGGHVRLYKMPDGLLLGFYREQGGYIKFAKIPGTDKVVYAYMNPEDDDRFELVTAVRSPRSIFGRADSVLIRDNRTQAVKTSKAEFLGVAYEVGQNRYMIGRATRKKTIQEIS